MLLHLWNNSQIPSSHPSSSRGWSCPSSTGVSKHTPSIPKNAITGLSLFLARLHPCAHSRNSSLFHRTARKVSKLVANPSEIPHWSSGAGAWSPGAGNTERCCCSSGENSGSAGTGAHERALVVPRGCSLSSLQLCAHFSWEGSEIPASGLAPLCQNSSDLCNHTRFSGDLISAVMSLWKPPAAKCFLLL